MRQIIEQDLQLDRIPQAAPGPAEHSIHKVPPQLAAGRFHALAHLTEEEFMLWDPVPRNEQHPGVFGQGGCALGATIAQVAQDDAPDFVHDGLSENRSRFGQAFVNGPAYFCGLDAEAAPAFCSWSGEMQHIWR